MNIIFQIAYGAQWGEELVVQCNLQKEALPMVCRGGNSWEITLTQKAWPQTLQYKYALRKPNMALIEEAGPWRTISIKCLIINNLVLSDSWRAAGVGALISSPFTSIFFQQNAKNAAPEDFNQHLRKISVHASCIPQGCLLCVTGSDEVLGSWNPDRPLLMQPDREGLWQTGFTPKNVKLPIYYKYAIYSLEHKKIISYEQVNHDRMLAHSEDAKTAIWNNDEQPQLNTSQPRGAGVAVPVFSLRSSKGYGVGQFSDIKLLADWAKKSGMSMIQVLPVNDTSSSMTWLDSYPYSGISVFALHPLYLDLAPLAGSLTAAQKSQLKNEQAELNALPQVDYERAMQLKWKYLQLAFKKDKGKMLADKKFKDFIEQRKEWIAPYAAFCYLRDKYKTANFSEWKEHAVFSAKKIATLTGEKSTVYESIALHYYMQYLLHTQLKEAADYCRKSGIIIKGDIPIGISRNSCDAWVAPELYNMDAQAGAPPDTFSTTGQNWGFPTYNWTNMAKDGYRWWQQRLQSMSEYFDAFRIDHILGFFRIWEIPLHSVQGLLGYFSPALPLSIAELNQRGAWFDADRLCTPYIRPHVMQELFGNKAAEIEKLFMEEYQPHTLRFKERFNTQRKIEDYFAAHKPEDNSLKLKLFDLLNDVVLIEDKRNPAHYHPRIAMHYTRSYRDLDHQQKQALDAIYLDFFYHRHNQFWKEQAMQKLPAVRYATNMLVCGEDLGMVPSCVPEVMRNLSLLSLIIQRMPNDSSVEFAPLQYAPYLSVCSPGSHDTSGLREWWEEDRAATQRFYNSVLHKQGEAPATCEPWIVHDIILQHIHAPSMWAVFPLQDLLAMSEDLRLKNAHAERINVPSNPRHYWRYRMHLTLDQLSNYQGFSDKLKEMMYWSRREL
ncbi:MAG: 4-alpha-glucanotransferase [Prevotellaceae bacterium]|nr:4-alpha-glucanotransferase [Prevotellaceae bacterium]